MAKNSRLEKFKEKDSIHRPSFMTAPLEDEAEKAFRDIKKFFTSKKKTWDFDLDSDKRKLEEFQIIQAAMSTYISEDIRKQLYGEKEITYPQYQGVTFHIPHYLWK